MHSTKRRRSRQLINGFTIGPAFAAASVIVNCSNSDERPLDTTAPDAGLIDAAPDRPAQALDATEADSAEPDAGLIDAAPLPIECASSTCAISLVTTMDDYDGYNRGQGFCALLRDGTVACWGANASGQLGRGEEAGALEPSSRAARVIGLSEIVELDHTCALDKNGAIWCWGTGPFLRDEMSMPTTERAPVKLPLPPATHVGFGGAVACAASSSDVTCWGSNRHGQIGPFDATVRNRWHPPHPIALPTGAPVRRLAVGDATFILREDGTTVSLGAQPTIGRITSIFPDPYPDKLALDGIFAIDAATDNVCATAGGMGYCWGAVAGHLNSPTHLSRALPKPMVVPEPIVYSATTSILETRRWQLPARWCAIAVSGAVYCWGLNESGQAGNGKADYAFDAVGVVGLPGPAAQVKVTRDTTCALLTSGKIYCWGSNVDGQLGNGRPKGMTLVPEEVVLP
jgi:Regulator of chromosome condensation (RCC1) repeat